MTRSMLRLGVAAAIAFAPVTYAASAAAAGQVEVAAGSGVPIATRSATYDSRYTPPFPFVEHSGLASQRLTLEPRRLPTVWGALTWLSDRRAGFELRIDYAHLRISGVNPPYVVTLDYQARQPPDFVLRTYRYERSQPWPQTAGDIDQVTLTGAVVARLGSPATWDVRALVGGGLMNVRGSFEPLGYTAFRLGGASVLFPEEFRVSTAVRPATTVGLTAGAELQRVLTQDLALVGGIRLFVPRQLEARVRVRTVVFSEMLRVLSPEEVEAALAPQPWRFRPVALDLTGGLRIRF